MWRTAVTMHCAWQASRACAPQLWRGLGREPSVVAASLLLAWERAAEPAAADGTPPRPERGAAAGSFAKRAWARIQQLLPLLVASLQDCSPGVASQPGHGSEGRPSKQTTAVLDSSMQTMKERLLHAAYWITPRTCVASTHCKMPGLLRLCKRPRWLRTCQASVMPCAAAPCACCCRAALLGTLRPPARRSPSWLTRCGQASSWPATRTFTRVRWSRAVPDIRKAAHAAWTGSGTFARTAVWRLACEQCADGASSCAPSTSGTNAATISALPLELAQLHSFYHHCLYQQCTCRQPSQGLCFTSAWILCCAHRAVHVPQQGEPAPPEHKAAVQLAALIVAADAAALATVTSAPGGFAPADGLLDAADVLAAAERAGDWLCSPVLWQVSCAPSHAAHYNRPMDTLPASCIALARCLLAKHSANWAVDSEFCHMVRYLRGRAGLQPDLGCCFIILKKLPSVRLPRHCLRMPHPAEAARRAANPAPCCRRPPPSRARAPRSAPRCCGRRPGWRTHLRAPRQ